MGTSQSQNICPYCAAEINLASIPDNDINNNAICGRCHGSIKKKQHKPSRIPFSSSNNNNIIKNTDIKIALQYLHIAPFIDEFEEKQMQNICSDFLINNYLKPYFITHPNISIQSQMRLIINDIEFKVIHCYPSNGVITEHTHFNLNTEDNNQLLTLKSRPIKQIHLSPTKSSLNDNINTTNLKAYLEAYLHDTDENYYIGNNSQNFNIWIGNYQKRHLIQNETFVSKGIEWRVMNCQPLDGCIDSQTKICCDGVAINDLQTIHIRPKCDTETDMDIEKFVLFKYFDNENLNYLNINGIDFMVYGLEPTAGIITCSTIIDSKPIKQAEIMHVLQQRDADFATRLQQQEYDSILDRHGINMNLLFDGIYVVQTDAVGLDEQLVNALPTYKYNVLKTNMLKSEEETEINSCIICLEEYENNDEIKILPCFHKYHKTCVDHWLKHSVKCPTCTTPV